MDFDDLEKNCDLRRIIVIGKMDRVSVDANEIVEKSFEQVDKAMPLLSITSKIITFGIGHKIMKAYMKNQLEKDKDIGLKFPMYTSSTAKRTFQFPPNHPVVDTAYAMCDIYPNIYVPISIFHDYFHNLKHSSLIKLCADLGAKEIYLEEGFENGNSVKISAKGNIPINNNGIGVSGGGNKKQSDAIKYSYTFPNNNQNIRECDSPWLPFEPSWKILKEMRLDNHVSSYGVEYTYTEDFGINAELSAQIKGLGLSIGGDYKEMKKYEYKYNVNFW